ncbi:uncharacterized protein F5891DRAFT_1195349 [Suillus fuscotomentosus]|uniref:Uncharacterized protein n=1 Tax=Suillus fuscotomentosus TaxID=1912939 RepID=A0AAD4DUV9_9AGAM|nr:uncharacterized protein F5891DRAFT_1195349 [Suillus fuscotomentosus]KAG1894366.1 hypothetical protein F5891DRAFT_1195349 [Suillus fuscotomentosus]
MPMANVQQLLNRAVPAQDQILNFCGISPEWHAADSVTRFLRTVLVYLEDIQFVVLYGGIPDLTLAHSIGELMYQKGLKTTKKPKLHSSFECFIQLSLTSTPAVQQIREYTFNDGRTALQTAYLSHSEATLKSEASESGSLCALHTIQDCPDYDEWAEISPCYDLPLIMGDDLPDKRKQHPADNPLLAWLPEHQSFLDETIFLEGRA